MLAGGATCVARNQASLGVLCALALVAHTPARADGSSKPHGEGGRFAVYYPIIAKYNKSGELFRIEGVCRSACTLFLGIRNVCIERKAELSFHAGPDRKTHKVGAQLQLDPRRCSPPTSRSCANFSSTGITWTSARTSR